MSTIDVLVVVVHQALADEPLDFKCVTDATGVAIEQAFEAVKGGGKFMILGVSPHNVRVSLSPFRVYNEERDCRIAGGAKLFSAKGLEPRSSCIPKNKQRFDDK